MSSPATSLPLQPLASASRAAGSGGRASLERLQRRRFSSVGLTCPWLSDLGLSVTGTSAPTHDERDPGPASATCTTWSNDGHTKRNAWAAFDRRELRRHTVKVEREG